MTHTRIPLADNLVLKADDHGWTIAEERVYASGAKAGEAYDMDLKHTGPSLYSALLALRELRLRRSEATSLTGLLEADTRFQKDLSDQLAPRLAVRLS